MSAEHTTLYSNALGMWFNHGRPSSIDFDKKRGSEQQLHLNSDLPFGLHVIAGSSEREGTVVAAVAGTFEALAQMPQGPLVRMHSACIFSEAGDNKILLDWLDGHVTEPSDIISLISLQSPSKECDCRAQREISQRIIAAEGGIYFDLTEQEGRGAGLEIKREAYQLHREQGLDTVQAYETLGVPFDTRSYVHCARFLLEHGIQSVRLMSNNPRKIGALTDAGIEVVQVPLVVGVTKDNVDYLRTKRDKGGHIIYEDERLNDLMK